jgi:hypothetical protein
MSSTLPDFFTHASEQAKPHVDVQNTLSGETEQRGICRVPPIGQGQGIPIATIS